MVSLLWASGMRSAKLSRAQSWGDCSTREGCNDDWADMMRAQRNSQSARQTEGQIDETRALRVAGRVAWSGSAAESEGSVTRVGLRRECGVV